MELFCPIKSNKSKSRTNLASSTNKNNQNQTNNIGPTNGTTGNMTKSCRLIGSKSKSSSSNNINSNKNNANGINKTLMTSSNIQTNGINQNGSTTNTSVTRPIGSTNSHNGSQGGSINNINTNPQSILMSPHMNSQLPTSNNRGGTFDSPLQQQLLFQSQNQTNPIQALRYVKRDFQTQDVHEISVTKGDIVTFQFSVEQSGVDWSYVTCLKTQRSGFVESDCLSIEPTSSLEFKKKIPRSIVGLNNNNMMDNNHSMHINHVHNHHQNNHHDLSHQHQPHPHDQNNHHHHNSDRKSTMNSMSIHNGPLGCGVTGGFGAIVDNGIPIPGGGIGGGRFSSNSDQIHLHQNHANNQLAGGTMNGTDTSKFGSSIGKLSLQKCYDARYNLNPLSYDNTTDDHCFTRNGAGTGTGNGIGAGTAMGYNGAPTIINQHNRGSSPFKLIDHGFLVVLHNFVAKEENDISVVPGDYVTLLNKDDPDWYWVRHEFDNREGFVPSQFTCDYERVQTILLKGQQSRVESPIISTTNNNTNPPMSIAKSHNDSHTYMNHPPDRKPFQDNGSTTTTAAQRSPLNNINDPIFHRDL